MPDRGTNGMRSFAEIGELLHSMQFWVSKALKSIHFKSYVSGISMKHIELFVIQHLISIYTLHSVCL